LRRAAFSARDALVSTFAAGRRVWRVEGFFLGRILGIVIRGFSETLGFFFVALFVLLAGVAFARETRGGLAFLETVLAFLDTALVFVDAALVFLDTALVFVDAALVFLDTILALVEAALAFLDPAPAFVEGALAFFFVVDFGEAADTPRFEADGLARTGRFATAFLGVF